MFGNIKSNFYKTLSIYKARGLFYIPGATKYVVNVYTYWYIDCFEVCGKLFGNLKYFNYLCIEIKNKKFLLKI